MKNKIKLSQIRQSELQKDEMHSLHGGVHPSCAVACSCTCECSISGQPASSSTQSTGSSNLRTGSQSTHQSNFADRATGSLHF
ncbi:MAG: TIGR04149 family rSAM-modified RiPP [Bacteroidales bacterium]|jgi:natural product precursor|nr:TIGR04149 family rSAM-modified RiPP [Bacteroidales bacterium]